MSVNNPFVTTKTVTSITTGKVTLRNCAEIEVGHTPGRETIQLGMKEKFYFTPDSLEHLADNLMFLADALRKQKGQ